MTIMIKEESKRHNELKLIGRKGARNEAKTREGKCVRKIMHLKRHADKKRKIIRKTRRE